MVNEYMHWIILILKIKKTGGKTIMTDLGKSATVKCAIIRNKHRPTALKRAI